jgi:hypothetical protein
VFLFITRKQNKKKTGLAIDEVFQPENRKQNPIIIIANPTIKSSPQPLNVQGESSEAVAG